MRVSITQIFFVCLAAAVYGRAEVQTWKSADGKQSVEGEFVRLVGNTVTLKRADGGSVSCQLNALDDASREQAKRLASAAKVLGSDAKPATGLKLSAPKASGVPSDEEIKAFLTESKEPGDETLQIFATFAAPTLKPDEIKDYQRKKKVPYRLTVELCRMKMIDGKMRRVRQEGQGCFVVMNEAGEVVDRQREALGKLCPS